ncbi:MAG: MFS transporter [Candidatus Poseidoniaceae archaeon]|nr:MFS transporter [Candidatus Poseidoniaceae archaeon]
MADMATGESKVADSIGTSAKELIDAMSDEDKTALKGWYWYDWANQAYALTVMTVVVPALMANLFNQATGGGSSWFGLNVTGDSFYAIILAISMGLVALSAPALGVIADRVPIKKKLLYWYTAVGCIFTVLMGIAPFLGDNGYMFLALTYVIGTVGFAGGNTIYYAFMPYLADKRAMDHVSSWGYAYGFMGGSLLLLVHLGLLLGSPLDGNINLALVFVTSSLWWWGFGLKMFKNTPEPEIVGTEMTFDSVGDAVKFSFGEIVKTMGEIKKFKVLATYLFAYLMFYDGVNTINGMASAFGESVLRINPSMNIALLLTVNIVAIPMSIAFGRLADKTSTKFALLLALGIYCAVAITAVGFAPLELDPAEDHEGYDFQYDWSETDSVYKLSTLYDRGVDGWVSESGDGDAAFRDSYLVYLNMDSLTAAEASDFAASAFSETSHRFSVHFEDGPMDTIAVVGDQHPTMLDQGGPMDWWPETMRDNVWQPLGITVSLQWIILGVFVGVVMGAAGAQARSMFTMLIPESRTTEFFGFFGFIGKAAAMIGPILYALSVALFDSRVAIMSIVVLIVAGSWLCSRVDIEEGIRVAAEEDARARAEAEN